LCQHVLLSPSNTQGLFLVFATLLKTKKLSIAKAMMALQAVWRQEAAAVTGGGH
jgi:hypothetical protein